MTGFAIVTVNGASGALTVELRAVNHRYLDVTVKLPDELRALEPALRERLAAWMKRGKIDCKVQWTRAAVASGLLPDERQIAALIAAAQKVRTLAADAPPLSVADILRWPGVLASPEADGSAADAALSGAVLAAFDQAWDEFSASRRREGDKLVAVLLRCCDDIETQIARIAPRIPAIHAAYRARLAARLQEAALDPDEDRLKQELALFAARVEVSEEMTRLSTHLAEVRRILTAGGVVGKRLDFLAQELHREANTLGAKSVDAELSQVALELKVLIEQLREQIQNLE